MRKRIAFVLGSMGQGGAEKVISVLSQEYAKAGWKTDIIVLLENKVEYELHESTRLIDFSGITSSRIKRLPYWLKNLSNYAKRNQPDVMLSFAARINIISQVACKKYTKKFVVSERNDPRYDGRSVAVDMLTKVMYPKVDCVVFQTKRAKEYFGDLTNGRIIPNPIKVSVMADKIKSKKIVSVGSLKKQKNHMLLIDAFSDIAYEFPDYDLTIYGEGGLRKELENRICELNLSERVFLPGGTNKVHEYISDASLFVLSSDYEGLSNALLEALMMGLPCVSTNCAGSDEYINGTNGIVVPVGDRNALANAMRKMLSEDDFRNSCGENAKKSASKFDTYEVLKKWHSVLD